MDMSKTDDTSRTGAQSLLQAEATERRERPEITAPSGVDDRLRRRYRLALSLTGILTVVSLVLVLLELNSQKHDIPTVNSAGRQRMLSQKLAKAALQLSSADDPASHAKARDELSAALEQFVETHRHLELDAELHSIPNEVSDAVVTGLLQVRPHFAAIDHAVQRLLAVSSQPAVNWQPNGGEALTQSIAADVETILAHEGEFLEVMDELVGVYEGQAEAHSDRLLWILYGLASAFILVLLLEGVFIFEPVVRTIQRQIGAASRASAASAENTALKRAIEALKREIERRKTVEEQLRKSANEVNRLLKLAGQVRHSVVICDARGRIQYANEPYVRLFARRTDRTEAGAAAAG